MPDSVKNFMPDGSGAADWHFLDAYSYNPLNYSGGALPWAMKLIFDNIVQYLKDGDWDTAAELMGAICHFAGDASCPLHATYDYNPDGTGHHDYETNVNTYVTGFSIPTNYMPQYLDDITSAALATLENSFDVTDDDPNGGVNIGTCHIWNDTIRSISENRVRAGVQFTANVWYTAMVKAGMMGPKSSVNAMTSYWQTSVPFTITATATANAQSVSLYYRYSIDNHSWGENLFFENDSSSPFSWSFTAPHDGYYEFYSIASDGENVESPPATADAMCGVDTLAPASSINAISPYWWTSTFASFQITATASDATVGIKNVSLYYRYSTDNSRWSAWTIYGTDTVFPWMWSVRAPSGNGYYEFYSVAQDKVNNTESAPTEADAIRGVDNVAPSAPAKSSPADGTITKNNSPTFTWAAATDGISGVARYELWVDDDSDFSSPEVLENTADSMTLSLASSVLAEGNYSWRVRAWDRAGNKGNFEAPWMLMVVTKNVAVTISPSEKSAGPGGDVTFTVTVTNAGNVADNYDLTVIDDAGWGATLSENLLTIPAVESRAVVVGVTVPSYAVDGDSTMILITATSHADDTVEDSASCIASCLKPAYGVDVSISPASESGLRGSALTYTVTVRNTGNISDTYTLENAGTAGWTLTLPSSVTDVASDEERQVTLTVIIPATAENGTQDNITVTATSSENTAISNSASCTAHCVKNAASVTSLTISPSRFALFPGYSGQVQSLTATLRDSNYNLLANKVITWSATTGRVSPSSGTTDAVGQISVTYTAPTVTIQTSATITASFAGDDLYEASSGTSSGIAAIPVSVNISASDGGTVVINVIEINVTVNILVVPANALSENTAITVRQAPLENIPDYKMVSRVFDVGPNGTTFTTPSTLTLPYDENELPTGVSEDNLAIYYYNTDTSSWERVGGDVDKIANTISVQINHLSEYAVMTSVGGNEAERGGLPWLIIGIIIVVAAIGVTAVLYVRRMRSKRSRRPRK